MSSVQKRSKRPIGFVLPALVFGIGIVALSIGIPKEIRNRQISTQGLNADSRIVAIERSKNTTVLKLGYKVAGDDYSTEVKVDNALADNHTKWTFPVRYLPSDPSVATADPAGDSKVANEYTLAGILEVFVGGWILVAALRQRFLGLRR